MVADPNDANYIHLRDYVDVRFNLLDRAMGETKQTTEAALVAAERNVERRLASLNEFRESLADQTASYATKHELDAVRDAHNIKIENLQRFMNLTVGALIALEFLLRFLIK